MTRRVCIKLKITHGMRSFLFDAATPRSVVVLRGEQEIAKVTACFRAAGTYNTHYPCTMKRAPIPCREEASTVMTVW